MNVSVQQKQKKYLFKYGIKKSNANVFAQRKFQQKFQNHICKKSFDRIILYEVIFFCQSKAFVKGSNRYGEGECIIKAYENEPSFWLINSIFHIQRKDDLLCQLLLVNQFNTHFNSYETEKLEYFKLVDFGSIYDYHRLRVYYMAFKMPVPLHHYLSHSPQSYRSTTNNHLVK